MVEALRFEEWVDVLRMRLFAADELDDEGELHSFRTLMSDYADVTPHQWYWDGEEELSVVGHLRPGSRVLSGGDACGRLSEHGRAYVEASRTAA
jgi:hypothetical protein